MHAFFVGFISVSGRVFKPLFGRSLACPEGGPMFWGYLGAPVGSEGPFLWCSSEPCNDRQRPPYADH